MGKKCIPGVFCIENMTLAILMFLFILLAYLYYVFIVKVNQQQNKIQEKIIYQNVSSLNSMPLRSAPNVIMDPYGPPLKDDGSYFMNPSLFMNQSNTPVITRGIPINIETRGLNQDYSQMGILTRTNGTDMILPLMGRRLISGLDKWQYYTISNTGNMNTKLPVSLKGKSCSGEYGCDIINNGDIVYVEGYNDTFNATVYENSRFNYIPYL